LGLAAALAMLGGCRPGSRRWLVAASVARLVGGRRRVDEHDLGFGLKTPQPGARGGSPRARFLKNPSPKSNSSTHQPQTRTRDQPPQPPQRTTSHRRDAGQQPSLASDAANPKTLTLDLNPNPNLDPKPRMRQVPKPSLSGQAPPKPPENSRAANPSLQFAAPEVCPATQCSARRLPLRRIQPRLPLPAAG